MSEAEGHFFKVDDWHLELVDVDSQDVHTSYLDKEIRLVISSFSLAKDGESKSFVENLHWDNDVKLQISHLSYKEIQEHSVVGKTGDLSRISESKKAGVDKEMIQEVKKSKLKGTTVITMKDILKKENPAGSLELYTPEGDFSSFYKKKRDVKEERKSGIQSSNKSVIKKAVEQIARYKKENPTVRSKVVLHKGKTPGRVSIAKKPSTTKALTIKTF